MRIGLILPWRLLDFGFKGDQTAVEEGAEKGRLTRCRRASDGYLEAGPRAASGVGGSAAMGRAARGRGERFRWVHIRRGDGEVAGGSVGEDLVRQMIQCYSAGVKVGGARLGQWAG